MENKKINLNALFELFTEKGLSYIDVSANKNGYFRAWASEGYNGRGNSIEVTFGHLENEIRVRMLIRQKPDFERICITEESAFDFIKQQFDTK